MNLRKIVLLSFLVLSSFQAQASSAEENDEVILFRYRYQISTTTEVSYSGLFSVSIPADIGRLTNLEILNIRQGSLLWEGIPRQSDIPKEIGNLRNLTKLYLSDNQLTGEIPATIGNLTNLIHLILSKNQLTGEIPKEIGNLTKLKRLFLDNNCLSSGLPKEIGNLTNLRCLFLAHNKLTGEIPKEIGTLPNLVHLRLSHNQFTGVYPNLFNLPGPLVLSYNHLNLVESSEEPICVKAPEVIIGVGGSLFNPRIFTFFEERVANDPHGTVEVPVKFHLSDVKGTPVEALEDYMIWFEKGEIKGENASTHVRLPEKNLPPELQKAVDYIQTEKDFHGNSKKNARNHLREEAEPTDTFDEIDS